VSEPITIYCVEAHVWGARQYQPGDAMTIVAPSFVREMLTSGRWSLEEPVLTPAQPPAPAPAAEEKPKRKPRRL